MPRPSVPSTRRSFLAGVGLAGIGLLGGCAGGGPASGDAGGEGFPRTVEHASGRTDVPRRPRRVVSATDNIDLDAVLAVGVTPVAFGFSRWLVPDLTPWAGAAATAARIEGPIADVDLERIAAHGPDLIVVEADILAGKYDMLSGIAPTVALTAERGDWAAGTAVVGRATGRETEASAAIDRARRTLDGCRARLAALHGARVAVIGAQDGQVRVSSVPAVRSGSSTGGGPLLEALGLVPADGAAPEASRLLSVEELSRLSDVDALLVQDYGPRTEALVTSPLFTRLPAVASGRVARLSPAATRASDLLSSLSVSYVAREYTTALLAAHAGRGSTARTAG